MSHRYLAPPHVTSVFINSGEARVVDGFAELPDDAPFADHQALRSVGFTLADTAPAKPSPEPSFPTAMELPADE